MLVVRAGDSDIAPRTPSKVTARRRCAQDSEGRDRGGFDGVLVDDPSTIGLEEAEVGLSVDRESSVTSPLADRRPIVDTSSASGDATLYYSSLAGTTDLHSSFAAKASTNPGFARVIPVGDAFQLAVNLGLVKTGSFFDAGLVLVGRAREAPFTPAVSWAARAARLPSHEIAGVAALGWCMRSLSRHASALLQPARMA